MAPTSNEHEVPETDSDMTMTYAASILLRRLQTLQKQCDKEENIETREALAHLVHMVPVYRAVISVLYNNFDKKIDEGTRQQARTRATRLMVLGKTMHDKPNIPLLKNEKEVVQGLVECPLGMVEQRTQDQAAANRKVQEKFDKGVKVAEALSSKKDDVELDKVMAHLFGLKIGGETDDAEEQLADELFVAAMGENMQAHVPGSSGVKKTRIGVTAAANRKPSSGGTEAEDSDSDSDLAFSNTKKFPLAGKGA